MAKTSVIVSKLPHCDIHLQDGFKIDAYADAKIPRMGCWANVCKECFDESGCKLGLGLGQRFLTPAMADAIVAEHAKSANWIAMDTTGTISMFLAGRQVIGPLKLLSRPWAITALERIGVSTESWQSVTDVPMVKLAEIPPGIAEHVLNELQDIEKTLKEDETIQ